MRSMAGCSLNRGGGAAGGRAGEHHLAARGRHADDVRRRRGAAPAGRASDGRRRRARALGLQGRPVGPAVAHAGLRAHARLRRPGERGGTGRAMRAMHQRIKGVAPDGRRYHALEPEAYAWVHATLAERRSSARTTASAALSRRPARALLGRVARPRAPARDPRGRPARHVGRVSRLRRRDVRHALEPSDVVDDVLESLAEPKPPRRARPRAAGLEGDHAADLAHDAASRRSACCPVPRARPGPRWTRANELELNAIGRVSRAATPVMPRSLRSSGRATCAGAATRSPAGPFGRAA